MAKVTVSFEIENEDSCEGCPLLDADSTGTSCPIFNEARIFSMRRPDVCKETMASMRNAGFHNDDIWIAIRGKRWRLIEAVADTVNASPISFHIKRKMKDAINEEIIAKWNEIYNSLCELLQDISKCR